MYSTGQYPATRLRRTRLSGWSRDMLSEYRLLPSQLIWPVFIVEGKAVEIPISSMPGITRMSVDILLKKAKIAYELGIKAIALFPVIDVSLKTPNADEALNPDNLICRAITALKAELPDMGVISDIALDPYTSHGQDGLVENGHILNDATVDVLCHQALVQAEAGCDIVAPSDMMDGRIGAIRNTLEHGGFHNTMILAYAAKYASSLYGPFREAVGSDKALGKADKRSYQMDPANGREAMREISLDIQEGADLVMVKPGLAYLDIIHRAASQFDIPVLAYQVSGEYAMIKAAAEKNWIDGDGVMMESLLAFIRAGAQAIFTYAALDIAQKLRG
ncbi:MAG: porphobilinogen synthase [Rickettsiales bacterium]|nr:porphobilinogen synthase [Rickettsiales bacterium]